MLISLMVEDIHINDMPFYFKNNNGGGSTYIRCGKVKIGGNEPNCYVMEKQCAGHICRVLNPDKTVNRAILIRDDGTSWSGVHLSNFETITRLNLIF